MLGLRAVALVIKILTESLGAATLVIKILAENQCCSAKNFLRLRLKLAENQCCSADSLDKPVDRLVLVKKKNRHFA